MIGLSTGKSKQADRPYPRPFAHLHVLLIAGPAGLRACAAGVVEAVILANRPPCEPGEDRLMDHCTEDATVVPFGEGQG